MAGVVRIDDINRHRTVATIALGDLGWRQYPHGPPLAFSRDHRLLAIGGTNGTVQIWRVRDPALLRTLVRPKLPTEYLEPESNSRRIMGLEPITGIEFGPHDKVLATLSSNKYAALWAVATAEQLATICVCYSPKPDSLFWPTPLAFSPNGHLLAIGALDSPVMVYAVPDGAPVTLVGAFGGAASDVVFSEHGERIAIAYGAGYGFNGTSAVWSLADHAVVMLNIRGNADPEPARVIGFSPDGDRVAAVDRRGMVHLWEAVTGLELAHRALPHPVSNISFDRHGHELRAFDIVTRSFVRWSGLLLRARSLEVQRAVQRAAYAASLLPPPNPTVDVSGRIVEVESGRPIAHALVSVSGSGRVATDTNGVFGLGLVPVGHVKVRVRCPSRAPLGGLLYDSTVTLVWRQPPVVLSIRADPSQCVEPDSGRREVTTRGLYSAGFEHSEFVPCADTAVAFAKIWGASHSRTTAERHRIQALAPCRISMRLARRRFRKLIRTSTAPTGVITGSTSGNVQVT